MKNIAKKIFQFLGIVASLILMFVASFAHVVQASTDACTAPIDVVLVFDRSHSMSYDSYPDPIQPLEDAQRGTIAFINTLNCANDRVGLVDFYGHAELTNSLTTDFDSVRANVNLPWIDEWTNTGAGIDKARQELNEHGRDGIKHVIVVLSDGNPTRPGSDSDDAIAYATQRADSAKDDGISIYTIGFGHDVNPDFLRSIASDPSNYYYAPTSADIENAYLSLAQTVCKSENTKPVITLPQTTLTLSVGDTFDALDGHATASDAEDGDITEHITATGMVNMAVAGSYTVTYNVKDSGDLEADPQTLTVEVQNPKMINLVATKILCDNESYLPNWGDKNVEQITKDTVANFLAGVNKDKEVCRVVPNYQFQWAPEGTDNPGDNYGLYDAPWTTFSSSTQINLASIPEGGYVWVREAWNTTYVPFTGVTTTLNTSAEMYCHVDTVNYDNYDRVDAPLIEGDTYYCVAFNAFVDVPKRCSDGIDNDGDTLIDRNDIGCWTNQNDPNTYDPNDDDETNVATSTATNTPPIILGAGSPLVISLGATSSLDVLARAGVTATDTEDGDITSHIVITGLDTIATSSVGTTTISYNVVDSGGLAAPTVDRLVSVETVSATNTKPVITLSRSTLNLNVGDAFNPLTAGIATANDAEDGDITANIQATSTVNTALAGTYSVIYSVQDSENLAADPKTLTVTVTVPTVVHGGGGGGGGAGGGSHSGGGSIAQILTITNENVSYLGDGKALVTWTTNMAATSRVVFGDNSVLVTASAPLYGYDSTNIKDTMLVTSHSMTVTGLQDGVPYFFRPVSDNTSASEIVGMEVTYALQNSGSAGVSVPGQCNYLLKYIKLGEANDPIEVEKLERFLNLYEGEHLTVNGIYEQADFDAVERFQNKYSGDVLVPWGYDGPTGYVYITTKNKVNEVFCQEEFAFSDSQKAEIAEFRAFLNKLKLTGGKMFGTDSTATVEDGSVVGSSTGTTTATSTTLSDANEKTADTGFLASVRNFLGFGDKGTTTEATTDVTGTDGSDKGLAAAVLSGVVGVATSYWFIFLLIVFATILFFRIRGAEKE